MHLPVKTWFHAPKSYQPVFPFAPVPLPARRAATPVPYDRCMEAVPGSEHHVRRS